jgi:hypothetical protein
MDQFHGVLAVGLRRIAVAAFFRSRVGCGHGVQGVALNEGGG